jgi:hypothetical protein
VTQIYLSAIAVRFSEQDIVLINNLVGNSKSRPEIIFKAGIDIYSEVLRIRNANKSDKSLYLRYVEGNRLPEDSDKYMSIDLHSEFPTKLFPQTSQAANQDVLLTEENSTLVQRLAQSSKVDDSTVLKAGLYLYAEIINAKKQGCTLGITEGNKVIHRITLKSIESED